MGLIGTLTSQVRRLHRRQVQLSFRDCWNQRKHSLSQLILLRPNDWLVLSLWSCQSNILVGQTLVPFTSDLTIFSDASFEGWGAHTDSITTSGRWPPQWRSFAINLVICDNKTAVAYINKPGGTRLKRLFLLAKSILLWCWMTDTRILCRHIPGRLNIKADLLRRKFQVVGSVAKSMCGRIDPGPLGQTAHQSFRHKRQAQATDFCVPVSGWDGMQWRPCHYHGRECGHMPSLHSLWFPKVLAKIRAKLVEIVLVAPW